MGMLRSDEMKYVLGVVILLVIQLSLEAKATEDMPLLIDAMDKIKLGISESNYENVEIGVERIQSLIAQLRPEDESNQTQNVELDEIDRLSESLKKVMKDGDKAEAEDRYVRIVNSCVICHDAKKPSSVYLYFSKNLAWKLVH
jgi:hypothetical protein